MRQAASMPVADTYPTDRLILFEPLTMFQPLPNKLLHRAPLLYSLPPGSLGNWKQEDV